MHNKSIRFLIVCSKEYSKYARVLIYTILKNTKDTKISCVIYADSPQEVSIKSNSRLSLTLADIPKQKTQEELRNYYCISRAQEILKALHQSADNILFLDADSLVRNNELLSLVTESTIQALMRENLDDKSKFLISSIYFPNSNDSKNFVYQWAESLKANLFGPWYSDQISFYKTFIQNRNLVSNIDTSYCDVHHNKKSTIWSAKGGMKFNQNWRHRYTREFSIYQMEMNISEIIEKIFSITIYPPTRMIITTSHVLLEFYFSLGRRLKGFWISFSK
jgi:hypothetical protein